MLYLEEKAMCTAATSNIQQQAATVCTDKMHPVLPPHGAIF